MGIILEHFGAQLRKSKYFAPLWLRGARKALATRFVFLLAAQKHRLCLEPCFLWHVLVLMTPHFALACYAGKELFSVVPLLFKEACSLVSTSFRCLFYFPHTWHFHHLFALTRSSYYGKVLRTHPYLQSCKYGCV